MTKPGKHRPKVGRVVPHPDKTGHTVLGKITLKLLGKITGWDDPNR